MTNEIKTRASRATPRTQKKASRNGQAVLRARIKPAIRGLNVPLLRKVQKHILEEPRRLNMSQWLQYSDAAPCGTVGCIAGWALKLSGSRLRNTDKFAKAASELLNIKFSRTKDYRLFNDDCDAARLFSTLNWPRQFSERYYSSEFPSERAEVTSDRIDYFIEEGK